MQDVQKGLITPAQPHARQDARFPVARPQRARTKLEAFFNILLGPDVDPSQDEETPGAFKDWR